MAPSRRTPASRQQGSTFRSTSEVRPSAVFTFGFLKRIGDMRFLSNLIVIRRRVYPWSGGIFGGDIHLRHHLVGPPHPRIDPRIQQKPPKASPASGIWRPCTRLGRTVCL